MTAGESNNWYGRMIVSGELKVGGATLKLHYVTVHAMLERLFEVWQTPPVEVGHGETPPEGYEFQPMRCEFCKRATSIATRTNMGDGRSMLLCLSCRSQVQAGIERDAVGTPDTRAWRVVSQTVDRECEFCRSMMRRGDTVWRRFLEPNVGSKMCAACYKLLDPNGTVGAAGASERTNEAVVIPPLVKCSKCGDPIPNIFAAFGVAPLCDSCVTK